MPSELWVIMVFAILLLDLAFKEELDIKAIKKYQFNENKIGVFIIVGTIVIYHFLAFETEIMTRLPKYVSNTFFAGMVLPGIFSAVVYALFTKNLTKAIIVGVLTVLFWYIWFVIYAFLTFTIK